MDNTETTKFDIAELSRWLKVLSEPNRLLLLDTIISGVQCNCEIGKLLGLPANLISHHLSVLREAGIVEATRDDSDARWVYYTVNSEVLIELQHLLMAFFDVSRIQPLSYYCGPKSCS